MRDRFECNDKVVLITTDRMSGFDRELCTVPFKGQVLNLTSAWWFRHTEHIVPNHVLSVPDANVTIGRKCTPFPIEFVMRGYITGSTGERVPISGRSRMEAKSAFLHRLSHTVFD